MTTKIKWRLGKLPDSQEVSLLVKEGILTKDEAREILISLETDEDRDKKSLQEEIRFLRELVKSMALPSRIVQEIRYIQQPYMQYPWYQNYQTYCANVDNSLVEGTSQTWTTGGTTGGSVYALNSIAGAQGSSVSLQSATDTPDFTDIKTF